MNVTERLKAYDKDADIVSREIERLEIKRCEIWKKRDQLFSKVLFSRIGE